MIVKKPTGKIDHKIFLTASKSESNRALIIKALCKDNVTISNLALAEDTQTMIAILDSFRNEKILDVGPAGTTFRFLTAFLTTQTGEWELTGSKRMLERPIGILVDALKSLGGKIDYNKNKNYPPLQITGGLKEGGEINIDGSISSQFISALLLIAPTLKNGLKINFTSECTSIPYVEMTLALMKHFGVSSSWKEGSITVEQTEYKAQDFEVEADWSAASYWYEIAALSPGCKLEVHRLRENSLQGDSAIARIFESFGVKTTFNKAYITLENKGEVKDKVNLDLQNCPDLAQTLVCTCAALGIEANFSGLKTLRIKETDRSLALQKELLKFGVNVKLKGDDEIFIAGKQELSPPSNHIETYHDHRMAMAFAPLSLVTDTVSIENPDVVGKSYPNFWIDLKSSGFSLDA